MLIFIGVSKGHSQCILYDQETIRVTMALK